MYHHSSLADPTRHKIKLRMDDTHKVNVAGRSWLLQQPVLYFPCLLLIHSAERTASEGFRELSRLLQLQYNITYKNVQQYTQRTRYTHTTYYRFTHSRPFNKHDSVFFLTAYKVLYMAGTLTRVFVVEVLINMRIRWATWFDSCPK